MIEQLLNIVGDKGLITSAQDMQPFLTDWRGRSQGDAFCVVSPATVEEVAAVVKLAATHQCPVFPQGGNTGLCYGAVPEQHMQGIVLSLRRMNRVRHVDVAANHISVDAGVILADVHDKAAQHNRCFPLHLGSEGSAQVGGLISTNAGGTAVVRYGPMRDLVAGLEVVLSDGRILRDMAGLRKDNTGYMLRELFIGAEGTLGIITGAVLHLHPVMNNSAHAWIAVSSPADAVSLLALMRDEAGSSIEAYELVSRSQFELVQRHIDRVIFAFAEIPEWSVMVELRSQDETTDLNSKLTSVLEAAFEQEIVQDAVIASSEQQAGNIWHVRHSVSEANKLEGIGIVLDICVRTADVAQFITQADAVVAQFYPQAQGLVVSHLGDGNIHYILMFQKSYWQALPDEDAFTLEIEQKIHDVAIALGGTISAEHGIGRKLNAELERVCDPLRYELMTGIRRLFDPHNLMNPGALLRNSDNKTSI